MNLNRFLKALFLISVMISGSGCALVLLGAGGAAGAGTVAYVGGELKSSESVSLDRAWNASQAAMGSMGFSLTSQEKDGFSGKLIARGAEDKKVTVKLKRQTDEVTQIGIRVGTFGDETLSRQVLEEIKKQGGWQASAPLPPGTVAHVAKETNKASELHSRIKETGQVVEKTESPDSTESPQPTEDLQDLDLIGPK
jgi:hypothetical protein